MNRFLLASLIAAVTAACSPAFHAGVRDDVRAGVDEADTLIEQQRAQMVDRYQKLDSPWVTGAPVMIEAPSSEPAALAKTVNYAHGKAGTLLDLANTLAADAGIAISVTPDAVARAALAADARGGYELALSGTLRSVLDTATSRADVSWRVSGDELVIYHLDTRSFALSVMPTAVDDVGTITNESGSGSTAGGGSGGGESFGPTVQSAAENSQTTTVNYKWDFFADLEGALQAMLSEEGKVAITRSSSAVVVRDNASVLRTVGEYIDNLNARMSRQVAIELTVLSIDASDSDGFGIDWDLLRSSGGGLAFRAASLGDELAGASSAGAVVVDPGSRFEGSEVLVSALRRISNAKVQRRTIVTALTNQLVRVQSANQRGYLPATRTFLVPQVGTETTAESAVQTTGFSLSLIPVVLDDASILLDVRGAISSPRPFRSVPVGDTRIELADVNREDIHQGAKLNSGEILVLTTLDQQTVEERGKGIGSGRWPLLGGSKEASRDRRLTVILLSPVIRS